MQGYATGIEKSVKGVHWPGETKTGWRIAVSKKNRGIDKVWKTYVSMSITSVQEELYTQIFQFSRLPISD